MKRKQKPIADRQEISINYCDEWQPKNRAEAAESQRAWGHSVEGVEVGTMDDDKDTQHNVQENAGFRPTPVHGSHQIHS